MPSVLPQGHGKDFWWSMGTFLEKSQEDMKMIYGAFLLLTARAKVLGPVFWNLSVTGSCEHPGW